MANHNNKNEEIFASLTKDLLSSYTHVKPPLDFGLTTYGYPAKIPRSIVARVCAHARTWAPSVGFREASDEDLTQINGFDLDKYHQSDQILYCGQFSSFDIEDQAIIHFKILISNGPKTEWSIGRLINLVDFHHWIYWVRMKKVAVEGYRQAQVVLAQCLEISEVHKTEIEGLAKLTVRFKEDLKNAEDKDNPIAMSRCSAELDKFERDRAKLVKVQKIARQTYVSEQKLQRVSKEWLERAKKGREAPLADKKDLFFGASELGLELGLELGSKLGSEGCYNGFEQGQQIEWTDHGAIIIIPFPNCRYGPFHITANVVPRTVFTRSEKVLGIYSSETGKIHPLSVEQRQKWEKRDVNNFGPEPAADGTSLEFYSDEGEIMNEKQRVWPKVEALGMPANLDISTEVKDSKEGSEEGSDEEADDGSKEGSDEEADDGNKDGGSKK